MSMNNRRKVLSTAIASIVLCFLVAGNMRAQEKTILFPSNIVPVSLLTASGDYNWPSSEIEIGHYPSPQLLDLQIGPNLDIGDPKMLYQLQFTDPGTINGFIGINPATSGKWNWRDPGLRPDSLRTPGDTTWRPRMNSRRRN
jgi:hypothetical protein